jgi:lipopolysaccharide export LptBFGC system permease protein LptF
MVLSLGTKWGLFRYYWVLLKLVITTGAVFLLLVHTQIIDLLAGIAAKTTILNAYPYGMQLKMVVTSGATVVVLTMLTGLAVYKPQGLTPYGQRKQEERRKGITTGQSATDQIQEAVEEGTDNSPYATISKSRKKESR